MHVRQVDLAFRLGTSQHQVHQGIVRQIEEPRKCVHFFVGQFGFMRVQETGQDDVVFQQSTAGAPAQAGQVFVQGRVDCGGRTGRFDDLVGRGCMIVLRNGDAAALGDQHRAFWRTLGGRIATFGKGRNGDIAFDDRDGWYGRHMDEFGCDVMIKRPDFCVFGMYPSMAETIHQS